jgi:hypothetical protein
MGENSNGMRPASAVSELEKASSNSASTYTKG